MRYPLTTTTGDADQMMRRKNSETKIKHHKRDRCPILPLISSAQCCGRKTNKTNDKNHTSLKYAMLKLLTIADCHRDY